MTSLADARVTGGTLPAYIWRDAMLAAEQGLPLKALDKSVQPPPEDLEMVHRARPGMAAMTKA